MANDERTGLPHYSNSTAATNNYEPAFLNQFEVIFTFPPILGQGETGNSGNNVGILTEQVKKIDGLPEITPNAVVEQYYKFAKRTYAAAKPADTTAELTIDFEVNLNNNNEMYVYNLLRKWADLIFDPMTGKQGLKAEYAGQMTVLLYNKKGRIYRKFDFNPVYPMDPFNNMAMNYTSEDIYVMTSKFKADAWKETRAGLDIQSETGAGKDLPASSAK